MAIQFIKALPADKLLQAFNNNILRFSSDVDSAPLKATLQGFGFTAVIYPHPDNSFFFNFREYIANVINTKNFASEFGVDFSGPTSSYQIGVEEGCFATDVIQITIEFVDLGVADDVASISLNFILGVEQITDRFTRNFDNSKALNILSPAADNGKAYVKFWHGYPFDFSYFLGFDLPVETPTTVVVNGTTVELENMQRINAVYLSDGVNYLLPQAPKYMSIGDLVVEQIAGSCGTYIKFRNKFGRWNYWLFEDGKIESRSSRSIGELNNDFNDVEDTVSPTIQLGRTGDSTLRVRTQLLTDKEKLVIEELIDSPKIYLLIGQKNTIPVENDWLELSLKSNSFVRETPKRKRYRYVIEFDLPRRYTQTL